LEIETLRTFASVARNISTRVDGLSFGHHRVVVGIKDPEQQLRMLQLALGCNGKPRYSVAKFAKVFRTFENTDAQGALNAQKSQADQTAEQVMEACEKLVKNSRFNWLCSGQPPTPALRQQVVDKLRDVASQLNGIAENAVRVWQEYEEEQRAFQTLVTNPNSRMIKAVESGEVTKDNLEQKITESRAAGATDEEEEQYRTTFASIQWRLLHDPAYRKNFEANLKAKSASAS
jgi:hypothetical protein